MDRVYTHEGSSDEEDNDDPTKLLIKKEERNSIIIIGNDIFFKDIYEYHQKKGFICILLSALSFVLTILFCIFFSTFMFVCIDWENLRKHHENEYNFLDAIYENCEPNNTYQNILKWIIRVFIIGWIYILIQKSIYVYRMYNVRHIWNNYLNLNPDTRWETWQNVIDRYHFQIDEATDSHYIVNRIMRWDNYIISMILNDVFSFDKYEKSGILLFTEILEINITYCIKSTLFKDNVLLSDILLRKNVEKYSELLRKRFIIFGVINLILSPFLFVAFSISLIYRYITEYHNNPKAIGLYVFTPTAKWKLRDFNELPHIYMSRLNKARPKIMEYLAQYVNYESNVIVKFFSFIIGTIFFILIGMSFLNPNIIISVVLLTKPVIFYVSIFGAIYITLKTLTDEHDETTCVYEPDEKFNELVKVLHYTPPSWDNLTTKERYIEIRNLFRSKWVVLAQEILSVFYVPFILMFYMTTKSTPIINFFRENSVYVDKLGVICFNANFDNIRKMNRHENETYMNLKMSNSFINFKQEYTWDPERRTKLKGKQRNSPLASTPINSPPQPTLYYEPRSPSESNLLFEVGINPTNIDIDNENFFLNNIVTDL